MSSTERELEATRLFLRYLAMPYDSKTASDEHKILRGAVLAWFDTPLARKPPNTLQPPDLTGHPYRSSPAPWTTCDHGVVYDSSKITPGMTATEVQKMFPRLSGTCPLGCGYHGIAYASMEHYTMGDW